MSMNTSYTNANPNVTTTQQTTTTQTNTQVDQQMNNMSLNQQNANTNAANNQTQSNQPRAYQPQTNVAPATGLMHSIHRAFAGRHQQSQGDTVVSEGLNKLRSSVSNTNELRQQLQMYADAQQHYRQAAAAVARAFQACFADQRSNPYTPFANELAKTEQQLLIQSQNTSHQLPLESVRAAAADIEQSSQKVESRAAARSQQKTDLDYYTDKLAKLHADWDAKTQANQTITPAEMERLERNVQKTTVRQDQYKTENTALISELNKAWSTRVLRLGPALVQFALAEKENAAIANSVLSTLHTDIDPRTINQTYLSQNPQLLDPYAGHVTREHVQQASVAVAANQDVAMRQEAAARGPVEVTGEEDLVVVRSEEQLRTRKQTVYTERVRLRKVVTTEMVSVQVPIRRERLVEEHEPINGPNAIAQGADSIIANVGEEHVLILSEERPVVTTRVVPIERIRMRKEVLRGQQEISMALRKEQFDIRNVGDVPADRFINKVEHPEMYQKTGVVDSTIDNKVAYNNTYNNNGAYQTQGVERDVYMNKNAGAYDNAAAQQTVQSTQRERTEVERVPLNQSRDIVTDSTVTGMPRGL